jgi:phenylalanyl-tRNA synthetase beta chain
VEQVKVIYEDNKTTQITPDLSPRKMKSPVAYINSCIGTGVNLSDQEIIAYLRKMGMPATIDQSDKETGEPTVIVDVPPTRSDVLHACDIMEDVAVAYGINRIPRTIPDTNTVAVPFPLNKLSDLLRREIALAGWSEVLPLILVSPFLDVQRHHECDSLTFCERSALMPRTLNIWVKKILEMRRWCWPIPRLSNTRL